MGQRLVCTWDREFHLTSPVLAPHGLHLLIHSSEFLSLQFDDQFFPLPLRRNPSFAVLLARLDHDTQGLSCLLPQSWYDNPARVPSLDGNVRCATVSCILHSLACARIS